MLKIFNCYSINNNVFYRINNETLLKETEENIQYNEVPNPNYPHAIINGDELREEFYSYKHIIDANYKSISIDILLMCLHENYTNMFPNILKLLDIIYSIPLSSVECERGFSQQNLIKTDLRNKLTNDTLHMLMLVGLEGPDHRNFDYDKAVRMWFQSKSRRIED